MDDNINVLRLKCRASDTHLITNHSLTNLFTHSLTHSFTHSPGHSLHELHNHLKYSAKPLYTNKMQKNCPWAVHCCIFATSLRLKGGRGGPMLPVTCNILLSVFPCFSEMTYIGPTGRRVGRALGCVHSTEVTPAMNSELAYSPTCGISPSLDEHKYTGRNPVSWSCYIYCCFRRDHEKIEAPASVISSQLSWCLESFQWSFWLIHCVQQNNNNKQTNNTTKQQTKQLNNKQNNYSNKQNSKNNKQTKQKQKQTKQQN